MCKGLFAGIVILIAGCVSSGTKVTQAQLTQLRVGETTESQVIAAFGEPNSVSVAPDGTKTDVYMHIAAHATAASYVPIVGIFASGAKGTAETAVLRFDRRGTLISTSSTETHSDVNTGLANQR